MWTQTKIDLVDNTLKELTGTESCVSVEMLINTDEIYAVRRTINSDTLEIEPDECVIYMKSGENFVIKESYKKVLSYIKMY